MNRLYELIFVFLVFLLLRLEISRSFAFKSIPFIKRPLLRLANGDNEDLMRNELFSDGLDLWNKFFASTQQWGILYSSENTFKFAKSLNKKSVKEIVSELHRNSWVLLVYPMLPDLIIDKVRKNPMTEDEIEPTVNLFLEQRLYRQLACLMAVQSGPPITADHFQRPTVNALIKTLEFLFKVRSGKVEELFEPMRWDKMFLVAPLVACTKQDPQIVRNILTKVFQVSKLQMLAQVCAGIMFTNFEGEYSDALYDRNEKLFQFIEEEIFKNSPHTEIRTALKACRVMNLIKLNPSNTQKILLAIYLDESDETVADLFKILKKITALSKSDYYINLINSFKLS